MLRAGKLPAEKLEELVLKALPEASDVVVGPGIGLDSAVIQVDGKLLSLTSDPITGATKDAGWLCVHVCANDTAASGFMPKWFLNCILLPEGAGVSELSDIVRGMKEAAAELGIGVIGGHSEVAPPVKSPVIVGFMVGMLAGPKPTPASACKVGDLIVMTKYAGIEGTYILAKELEEKSEAEVSREAIARGLKLRSQISVVREGISASRAGLANAMHDPTEGGILCGLWEMAYASGVEIRVDLSRVPVLPETAEICRALGADPLKLIGSGSLLISVPRALCSRLVKLLRGKGINATVVGEVTSAGEARVVDVRRGIVSPPDQDELFRLIEEGKIGSGG
ncbi:MAG: hypothetical protein DRN96_00080 [Thermoproteota archaeon]|nr:MAG: hypothetical protein DRN96_00080 [Candidatus Korarchaeota archaeon]RLG54914.1 MAG: hypothetical protein DRN99_04205 [Candidatus Korarchaeota archaeon]